MCDNDVTVNHFSLHLTGSVSQGLFSQLPASSPTQSAAPVLMRNEKVTSSMPQREVFIPDAATGNAISSTSRNEYKTWVNDNLIPCLEKNEISYLTTRDKLFPMNGNKSQLTNEAIQKCSRLLVPLLPGLGEKNIELLLEQYSNKAILLEVQSDCLEQFQSIIQQDYNIISCTTENEVDEMAQRLKTQLSVDRMPSSQETSHQSFTDAPPKPPRKTWPKSDHMHSNRSAEYENMPTHRTWPGSDQSDRNARYISDESADGEYLTMTTDARLKKSKSKNRPLPDPPRESHLHSLRPWIKNDANNRNAAYVYDDSNEYLTVEPDISDTLGQKKPKQRGPLPDVLETSQESRHHHPNTVSGNNEVKHSRKKTPEYSYVLNRSPTPVPSPGSSDHMTKSSDALPETFRELYGHSQHTWPENNNSNRNATYMDEGPDDYLTAVSNTSNKTLKQNAPFPETLGETKLLSQSIPTGEGPQQMNTPQTVTQQRRTIASVGMTEQRRPPLPPVPLPSPSPHEEENIGAVAQGTYEKLHFK